MVYIAFSWPDFLLVSITLIIYIMLYLQFKCLHLPCISQINKSYLSWKEHWMKPGVVPSERLGAVSSTVWVLHGERSCLRMFWVFSCAHTADCCAKSGERGQVGTTAANYGETAERGRAELCTWGPGSCSPHGPTQGASAVPCTQVSYACANLGMSA